MILNLKIRLSKACLHCWIVGLLFSFSLYGQSEAKTAREVFSDLILASSSEQAKWITVLSEYGDPVISKIYGAWRAGGIYIYNAAIGPQVLQLSGEQEWLQVLTGERIDLSEAEVAKTKKSRPSRKLRKAMKGIIDTLGLKSIDADVRINSAIKMGRSQKSEYLEPLRDRLAIETEKRVIATLQEAIAISLLSNGNSEEVLQSVNELGAMKSIPARDFIEKIQAQEATMIGEGSAGELEQACAATLAAIDKHINAIEFYGSFFRGFSTGSVLLIVSFGLAITFGLMGVINMAHGEFVAIGGYVTFMVQRAFIDTWGIGSAAFEWYFIVALPISFLVAAFLGLLLEKSVIRFLYRRPLESLLCTWGISMIMQQGFRLIFGAANVQVNNPNWLMGNLSFGGFNMSFTRLFVLLLALIVVFLTWLLLRKTNLGLHIRAVMQNREMASGLGIPVARVNSMTFALGCGLAAIGGAALSQIGNVGPLMGQAYIVDSFMVVVIGSVGNLLGAGISAMGIGLVDQLLQPSLGPVMGKITVFLVIILFLQWRPGGLFPARSRSLED
jgi:urea transport system permease protein